MPENTNVQVLNDLLKVNELASQLFWKNYFAPEPNPQLLAGLENTLVQNQQNLKTFILVTTTPETGK